MAKAMNCFGFISGHWRRYLSGVLTRVRRARVQSAAGEVSKPVQSGGGSQGSKPAAPVSATEPTEHICSVCQSTFRTKNGLSVHLSKIHGIRSGRFNSDRDYTGDKQLVSCPGCQKMLQRGSLSRHRNKYCSSGQ